jgi:hypothetical protein
MTAEEDLTDDELEFLNGAPELAKPVVGTRDARRRGKALGFEFPELPLAVLPVPFPEALRDLLRFLASPHLIGNVIRPWSCIPAYRARPYSHTKIADLLSWAGVSQTDLKEIERAGAGLHCSGGEAHDLYWNYGLGRLLGISKTELLASVQNLVWYLECRLIGVPHVHLSEMDASEFFRYFWLRRVGITHKISIDFLTITKWADADSLVLAITALAEAPNATEVVVALCAEWKGSAQDLALVARQLGGEIGEPYSGR